MEFKTEPFQHQLDEWQNHRNDEFRAIFWEQGLGKSKAAIDKAAWLYEQDKIDTVLVVAPPGVERNWVTDEIPAHNPVPDTHIFLYRSKKSSTKWHKSEMQEALEYEGLAYVCIHYDSFRTKDGKAFVKKVVTKRTCLTVLDESTRIKTPKARRTQAVLASSRYVPYRMIMTGTPFSNGPFDIYAPFRFLRPEFWAEHQLHPFSTFKSYFGVFVRMQRGDGREYPELVSYRHLDELKDIVEPHSSRVTKEDALDLPPKLFSKSYFTLNPEQWSAYQELRDEYMCWLDGDTPTDAEMAAMTMADVTSSLVTAPLAIVRMIRLQQITCGFIPREDGQPIALLGKTNPRLDALFERLADIDHSVIIWSRFRLDIDNVMNRMQEEGYLAVRYDGSVDDEQRAANKAAFQSGEAQFFVATEAAAMGLTLVAAKTMIFLTSDYKLEMRQQKEDRAHRIGQDTKLQIIDFCAQGADGESTCDHSIVEALRNKMDIANTLTGDEFKEWI